MATNELMPEDPKQPVPKQRMRIPHLDSDKATILKQRKKLGPVKKMQLVKVSYAK